MSEDDRIKYWDHFNEDLYAEYILVSQFNIKSPKELKMQTDNINKVVNRYFRMKRKKFFRKLFFFCYK